MSKRHGDASFEDFYNKGYLKEAILNYVALLGWNPGTDQEFFTLTELIEAFSTDGISKSPSVFDVNKLRWMNAEYIRRLSSSDFHALALPYYGQVIFRKDIDLYKLSELMQKRTELLSEIPEKIDFLEAVPEYDLSMYSHQKMKTDRENAPELLKHALPVIEAIDDWKNDTIYESIMNAVKALDLKAGQMLWPIRTALSGKQSTPGGASEIMELLGKDESLRRVRAAIERLERENG